MSDHLAETNLRRRLGIPTSAQRVLILAESSHWDPDWLYTSAQYYARYVERNLLQAIYELNKEPRRVYSVECMFFLRMFWEQHPELQETLRALGNEGRLRMTRSGVSTADTLLPGAEAILRDLLLGQEWLRINGIQQEPRLAYFPDCFGHTPALPVLLNAAGFTMTAFSRLDGMYMTGCDYDPRRSFPRPASSAELLQKGEKSLDFIWRGSDGSQVLAHWNAFTYGQGDMLAYRGVSRVYIVPRFFHYSDRSDRLVARRIQGYVAQLEPYCRTPYLFCPIGMDFIAPVPDLLELLDRYNQQHYPETGTWVVNAGLDDYLNLVDCYRERLPALELDPNPYWTGFYTSRPTLKRRCHELVNRLILAESCSHFTGDEKRIETNLKRAWWVAATSNHHDFITGTSPDKVVETEQLPMLEQAIGEVKVVLDQMTADAGLERFPSSKGLQGECPTWERHADKILVKTPFYNLELSETAGGNITRAWNPVTGAALLEGMSNELVDYAESGGLWRMGMEFRGGKFQVKEQSSSQPVQLEIQTLLEGLEITYSVTLGGRVFQCAMLCQSDQPLIRFRVSGRAAEGHTVCVRFRTGLKADRLVMENPGGIVSRPVKKIYTPTFWPMQHFCHLQNKENERGIAILMALPGALSYHLEDQSVELVVLRNATWELVNGFIPIVACPARGHEKEDYTFQYAIGFTESGGWQENRLPQAARDFAHSHSIGDYGFLYQRLAQEIVLSSPEVWLEALKPAWRGEGIIARLCCFAIPETPVTFGLRGKKIREAHECDARERDLRSVEVQDGMVRLKLRQSITSVRILS